MLICFDIFLFIFSHQLMPINACVFIYFSHSITHQMLQNIFSQIPLSIIIRGVQLVPDTC